MMTNVLMYVPPSTELARDDPEWPSPSHRVASFLNTQDSAADSTLHCEYSTYMYVSNGHVHRVYDEPSFVINCKARFGHQSCLITVTAKECYIVPHSPHEEFSDDD